MKKGIKKIIIIPGKFIKKTEEGKYIIKCLITDNQTEDRMFDSFSLEGMKNPNLVFIGIMTGVGIIQADFCQADEFEDLFKKKWKSLIL